MIKQNTKYRYEWLQEPFNLPGFYYHGVKFFVLDKETNEKLQVATFNIYEPSKGAILNPKLNNQQFFDFCAETAPDIFADLSKEVQTSDMQKKIAQNTSRFNMLSYMNLDKLLVEGGKDKVEEVCLILIRRFGNAICYLPDKFMYPKLLDEAVLCHRGGLSKLKPDYRTLERCILAVRKWGTSLRSVPKEYWELEVEYLNEKIKLYELAVRVDGIALKLLPLDLKTLSLCEIAVKSNPDAIIYVPPKYITLDFMMKLSSANIKISARNKKYVDECLRNNSSLNKDYVELSTQLPKKNNLDIPLSELSEIINKSVLKVLSNRKINTVGELLNISETPNFVTMFPKMSYITINALVNILKCKYLNIDPMIDFNEKITADFLQSKLGISSKVASAIEISDENKTLGYLVTTILYKEINLPNIVSMKDIPHIDCIHEGRKIRYSTSFNELYEKFTIIVNYYQKKQAKLEQPDIVALVDEELSKIWPELYQEINSSNSQETENIHIAKILTEMNAITKTMEQLNQRINTLNIELQKYNDLPKGVAKHVRKK